MGESTCFVSDATSEFFCPVIYRLAFFPPPSLKTIFSPLGGKSGNNLKRSRVTVTPLPVESVNYVDLSRRVWKLHTRVPSNLSDIKIRKISLAPRRHAIFCGKVRLWFLCPGEKKTRTGQGKNTEHAHRHVATLITHTHTRWYRQRPRPTKNGRKVVRDRHRQKGGGDTEKGKHTTRIGKLLSWEDFFKRKRINKIVLRLHSFKLSMTPKKETIIKINVFVCCGWGTLPTLLFRFTIKDITGTEVTPQVT